MTNHYLEVLELAPGATEREIKTAYRRLAKKYHPDTSREPNAEARFIEITEAYRFLTEVGPSPHQETTTYEYDPYAEEYAARRAQAKAYARQKAAEAARDRVRSLRQLYRILNPLVLVAGLFNMLLVLDYGLPARQYDEKIRQAYRVFAVSGRGSSESWNYDALEFEQFTLQVGKGEAVLLELPDRGLVVATPLLKTIKYASLRVEGEEKRLKPAYGFYQVFVFLIPAALLGSFFYFRLSSRNDNKLTVGIIALFAFAVQLFLF